MAFKKEKNNTEEKFLFTQKARDFYAKEIAATGFDFYKFLENKKAIAFRKGQPIVLEYDTIESQTSYVSKFVRDTEYFTFEAGTLDWAWKKPFAFWSELRNQAQREESKMLWNMDRLEESRTGRTHEDMAKEKLAELSQGLSIIGFNKSISAPRLPYAETA